MLIRAAGSADCAQIMRLLEANALPTADIEAAKLAHFLVLQDDDGVLVGAIGLEPHAPVALLRSLAVASPARAHGHGAALVDAIQAHARALGVSELYLLTTTAADYFARRGYRVIARAEVPDAIRATREFATLCPASAVCMHRDLRA